MAINRNLLLPSASSSSAIVKKTFNASALASIKTNKKELTLSPQKTSLKDLLSSINETVKKINIIVKKTTLSQSKAYKDGLKEARLARNAERERKLEEKKKDKPKEKEEKKIPGLGFLDRIKRFLFFTFLGWLTNKYWDKLPQVLEFTKKLTPIIDVIETIGGALFNGVVNFIDTGYKVYDGLRDFTKKIGGEDFQKKFDDFSKNLNTFINIAIIAGMATMGGTDFGMGKKPGQNARRTNIRGSRKTPGRSRYGTSSNAARRYAQRFGIDAATRRFGQEGVRSLGGKYARDQVTNLARKGAVGLLGKGGTKAALRIVKPLVRNIPLIGGIMEFVLSWMSGDSPGKAAFKGVGAGLGTWVGGAIGSLIPIPGVGTAIGMWLGSQGGSALGEALYNKIFENREPGQKKLDQPKKKARGGVTRGGKKVAGNIGRSLKVTRKYEKIIIPPNSSSIVPGNSIGGENQIKKLFPEPSFDQLTTHQNPFGFIFNSTQKIGDISYIGPLLSVFGKLILGQLPTSSDYRNISLGLTAWINNAIVEGQLKGKTPFELISNMADWAQSSVKELISGVSNQIITDLGKMLKLASTLSNEFTPSMGPGGGPVTQNQQEAFELIRKLAEKVGSPNPSVTAAIAMLETGWLSNPNSVYFASGKTNPFGQTGRGPKGSVIGKDGQEHAVYNSLEEGVKSHVDRWKSSYIGRSPQEIIENIRRGKGAGAPGMYNTNPNWTTKVLSVYQSGTQPSLGNIDPGTGGVMQTSARGTQISGELGRFLKSAGVGSWGSGVWQHPEFGGSERRSYPSWHNVDRAIDVGGYWPEDQVQILRKIEEFNKKNNVRPVELLYGKPGTPKSESHRDHVHVAYKDGGMIGPNKPRNIKPLQESASYDEGYMMLIQPVIIEKPVPAMDNKINFSGGGSVNINKDKSSLFIR